jgi:hypothetical protein
MPGEGASISNPAHVTYRNYNKVTNETKNLGQHGLAGARTHNSAGSTLGGRTRFLHFWFTDEDL